jgi:predicted amidohydrolase
MAASKKTFKLAVCQNNVTSDKTANLAKAEHLIREAYRLHAAEMIVLPEMFNCPYGYGYFRRFAESFPGKSTDLLSGLAKELGIYIIGGSIPEAVDDNIYNTSFTFDRKGKLLARHRKIHLFDVNIKGGISFKESSHISPGSEITVFDTDICRTGVAICYDMRFPELIRKMALEGAVLIIIPAAFNMTTGPAHWHITARTRALDNQVYFVCASPARDVSAGYTVYGHSLISDPWGSIISEASTGEEVICGTIELDKLYRIRKELPLLKHKKFDLYKY